MRRDCGDGPGNAVRRGGPGRRHRRPDGRRRQGRRRARRPHAAGARAPAPWPTRPRSSWSGEQVPTSRPVTFVREDPPQGGPAAGLLAGVRRPVAGPRAAGRCSPSTCRASRRRRSAGCWPRPRRARRRVPRRRGRTAPAGGGAGRRARWTGSRPADPHGLPLAPAACKRLTWPTVAAAGDEARDVDTWADLRDLRTAPTKRSDPGAFKGLRGGRSLVNVGSVNLHDWIDELCDVLEVETEVDEALVLDLARAAAHNVEQAGGAGHGVPARVRGAAPATPTRSRSRTSPLAPRRWPRAGTARPTRRTRTTSTTEIPDDSLRRPQQRRVRRVRRARDQCVATCS